MTLRDDLLGRGYLADKLPPTFTSEPFGECIEASPSLPQEFNSSRIRELEQYELGRAGQLRRRLSLPNPVSYYQLATEMESSWPDIEKQLKRTTLSWSKPVVGTENDRALIPSVEFSSLPESRPVRREAGRVLLKTDVAGFYPSIYTHSIPWALHGKAVAKADRTSDLLGNRLDKLLRDSQFGQTKGVPIGPDTSLVIAEILLAPVDERLVGDFPNLVGFRHMDDYEIACSSRTEAEKVLAALQTRVSEFELQLNAFKTDILDLPTPALDEWTADLAEFEFRETAGRQKRDLLKYFDTAFRLSRRYPGRAVIAYALRRLAGQDDLDLDNWKLQQALTVQALVGEPGSLAHALEVLLANAQRGATLDAGLISRTLNDIVVEHAPLGHHSEVAWSIWAALALGYRLEPGATAALSKMDNSVVALLALDARNQGALDESSLDTHMWEQHLTPDDLHGPSWLLSYEAGAKGWLPSASGNHIASDPAFSFLKDNGVYFYDEVDRDEALEALRGFLSRRAGY